jgi:DNA ligase (NAD+)
MKASIFLKSFQGINQEDLQGIKGLGEVLASNFLEFTNSTRCKKLIKSFEKLEADGNELDIFFQKTNSVNQKLAGQIICITGSFDISRDKIKEKLESLGGKISSSVSSSTTILLAGEKPGSKLDQAKKYGTKIVNNYQDLIK